jgi:23S rRNA pseudouridine2605 synthase
MRLNQYLAHATGLSRRGADELITAGQVTVDGQPTELGQQVEDGQKVAIDGKVVQTQTYQTIVFNKPTGYITSRRQQGGAPTIYELLPTELRHLKPVGRLDKDSSGLLLLTNDGQLAQRLSHPSAGKWKYYQVKLHRTLSPEDLTKLQRGVELTDGISRLDVSPNGAGYLVKLQEGRNRQIRRSFEALNYTVTALHRDRFGQLELGTLASGAWRQLKPTEAIV